MAATREASVPSEWLPLFIGHRIWTRPTSAPQIESPRWCELLDVWEATHHIDEAGWWLRRALVVWDGQPTVTIPAQQTHVEGVPAKECTGLDLENGMTHYTWTEPFDDPPTLEQRPWDWAPTLELTPAPEVEVVPTESGDQHLLF